MAQTGRRCEFRNQALVGRLIVSTDRAAAARQQRAQVQQQQMALQAGQAMAAGAEKLGRIDAGDGKNVLQALVGR